MSRVTTGGVPMPWPARDSGIAIAGIVFGPSLLSLMGASPDVLQHASFTRTFNGVVLKDLGSKNGIHVNTVSAITQRLSDGDLIEMGPLKLRLMDPEDKYLRDLEDNPERLPPPGGARPKPVVAMPAALAVSVPAASAFAPPSSADTRPGANAPPRKPSRLAPRGARVVASSRSTSMRSNALHTKRRHPRCSTPA